MPSYLEAGTDGFRKTGTKSNVEAGTERHTKVGTEIDILQNPGGDT